MPRRESVKLVPFEVERWQSTWENTVDFNLSESGVQPIPLRELLGDEAATERFLDYPLAYSQGNGTPGLRTKIAAMYHDASPGHVLVTNGSSEANLLAMWHLVERGDEVVVMLPNYMENWGLAQMFGRNVKPLRLQESRNWQFDPDELSSLVTPKTRPSRSAIRTIRPARSWARRSGRPCWTWPATAVPGYSPMKCTSVRSGRGRGRRACGASMSER